MSLDPLNDAATQGLPSLSLLSNVMLSRGAVGAKRRLLSRSSSMRKFSVN